MLLSELYAIRNGRTITRDSMVYTDFQGLKIVIENPEGSVRKGINEEGDKWSTRFYYPYGFIRNTLGEDGEEIDCFVGSNPDGEEVYVIHQKSIDGSFDEDKCMLGFDSEEHARDAYLAHYQDDSHLGPIQKMLMPEFKRALKIHKIGKAVTEDSLINKGVK